jgi:hypothetical protein
VADILIRGGDVETAGQEVCAAVRDIFAVDPVSTSVGTNPSPDTRDPVAIASLVLAIPGTALAVADIAARIRRLFDTAAHQRRTTGARLLIDLGDGSKPLPLEEANREHVLSAITALEQARRRP